MSAGSFWSATAGGATLRLKVQPKARREAVDGLAADADGSVRLRVATTAAPEDGKANKAVVALLAQTFGLPKSALRVTHGSTSRLKTVAVDGDPAALSATFAAWAARHTPQG